MSLFSVIGSTLPPCYTPELAKVSLVSSFRMETCEIRCGNQFRSFTVKNLKVSALIAVFDIDSESHCWLKDSYDTYLFPDENGNFPTLEPFGLYKLETTPIKSRKRAHQSTDGESDEDLFHSAWEFAHSKKGRRSKGKGKRAIPTKTADQQADHVGWHFKITIGEWKEKKITPQRNCLLRCTMSTNCTAVKEGVARELMVPPTFITLYDSDYLEITDSPGRIGKIVISA